MPFLLTFANDLDHLGSRLFGGSQKQAVTTHRQHFNVCPKIQLLLKESDSRLYRGRCQDETLYIIAENP